MNRAIIVHGWEGKPNEGWMPWLKSELEKRSWEVLAPQMPHPMFPKISEWLEVIKLIVGDPTGETYLIGHSLGCFTILKYLEQLKSNQIVGGVVMVAGFAGHLKHNIPLLQPYYEGGLDWEKVRSHCQKFVAIASQRDDLTHFQSLTEFKEKLGAKIIINNDWVHFSGVEGIKELPIVLESLLSFK